MEATVKKRMKQTVICAPLVYGSIAFWLGKKGTESATHKWTLFVRGPSDEDLSYFIEKVVFKLHPSFSQPVREITTPPFEVTEKGWGEFEATIRLHFKDAAERPVEFAHVVKLYDGSPQVANPVVSEVYDEVVFTEPYEDFHAQLVAPKPPTPGHPLGPYFGTFDDAKDVEVMVKVSEYVRGQLDAVKNTIARLDHQISICKQTEQSRVQQQQQRESQQAQQKAAAAQQSSSSYAAAGAAAAAPTNHKVVASAAASAAQPTNTTSLGSAAAGAAQQQRLDATAQSQQVHAHASAAAHAAAAAASATTAKRPSQASSGGGDLGHVAVVPAS